MVLLIVGCAGKKLAPTFDIGHPIKAQEVAKRAICLSGEGKAILSIREKKNGFRFAMRHTPQDWMLGITVPLLGEEVLHLNFSPYSLSGGAYDYLVLQLKKKQVTEEIIQEQFRGLAVALQQLEGFKYSKFGCQLTSTGPALNGKCPGMEYSLSAESLSLQFIANGHDVEANYSAFNGQYFENLELRLTNLHSSSLFFKFAQCQ